MADLVVGYDGSDASDAALETAIELARQFGDRLVIAYADLPPERRRGEEFKAHQEALRELGIEVTQRGRRAARRAGWSARSYSSRIRRPRRCSGWQRSGMPGSS